MSVEDAERSDADLLRQSVDPIDIAQFLEDRWNESATYVLDEIVYDAKGSEAAAINNEGLHAQVEYLIGRYGAVSLTAILADHFYPDA